MSGNQALMLALLFLLQSCANIVPPEGGKKDERPPVLLSLSPEDSVLNTKMSRITLRFNKFMEVQNLQEQLEISPLLPVNPTVISYGKRVEIELEDSFLQPNTTYRLDLGNALVDNREANPYKNFVYLFSTGSYFDSLSLRGRVFDAYTGLPDSSATVFLYPGLATDSAVVRKKPVYAQQVDADGHFTFNLLPAGSFQAYAVQDADHNFIYTPGTEKIDFLDLPAVPAYVPDSQLVFRIFSEPGPADTSGAKPGGTTGGSADREPRRRGKPGNYPRNDPGYRVLADTLNRDRGSLDIRGPLLNELHKPLSLLDSARIYLSYDDQGIEAEAIRSLEADSASLKVLTEWQADKVYTLRLVKGWARDTSGAELPPGRYSFRTKREEDYGTLKLHIDSSLRGASYILDIRKGSDSIYRQPVLEPDIRIPLLDPGDYTLRIIVDENGNGRWDTGDLFKKRHAERVIPYKSSVVIKSGWENEIDFNLPADGPKPSKQDRFAEPPEAERVPD